MANNKLHSWIKNIRMEWGIRQLGSNQPSDSNQPIGSYQPHGSILQHHRSRQHAQQLQRLDAR